MSKVEVSSKTEAGATSRNAVVALLLICARSRPLRESDLGFCDFIRCIDDQVD